MKEHPKASRIFRKVLSIRQYHYAQNYIDMAIVDRKNWAST